MSDAGGTGVDPTPDPTATQPLPGYSPPSQASTFGAPASATRARVRWNIWAGVIAASALLAVGNLWGLGKFLPDVLDVPFREQLGVAVSWLHAFVGLATLAALPLRRRSLLAVLGALLGATFLLDVTYGWYLQIDQVYGSFNVDYVLEFVVPNAMPSYVLAFTTLVAAALARTHPANN